MRLAVASPWTLISRGIVFDRNWRESGRSRSWDEEGVLDDEQPKYPQHQDEDGVEMLGGRDSMLDARVVDRT